MSGTSTTIQGLSSIQDTANAGGILGPATPSTQQGDSIEITGLTADASNPFYSSAPAAYASFHVPVSTSHDSSKKDNLEWDSFAENNARKSIDSHQSHLQSVGTSLADDVFSPISKTDSSLRSMSLSPFRLAAVAASSARAGAVSAGSSNGGFHWDSSYDPFNGSNTSAKGQHNPTEHELSRPEHAELHLYATTVPVLAEAQYWV